MPVTQEQIAEREAQVAQEAAQIVVPMLAGLPPDIDDQHARAIIALGLGYTQEQAAQVAGYTRVHVARLAAQYRDLIRDISARRDVVIRDMTRRTLYGVLDVGFSAVTRLASEMAADPGKTLKPHEILALATAGQGLVRIHTALEQTGAGKQEPRTIDIRDTERAISALQSRISPPDNP